MKANYAILQAQGQQLPVLIPAEATELAGELAKLGHPVAGGQCELQNGAWTCSGELVVAGVPLRSRQTHDAEHLRRHFGDGTLLPGVPFSSRAEAL